MEYSIRKHLWFRHSNLCKQFEDAVLDMDEFAEKFAPRCSLIRRTGGNYGFYWIDADKPKTLNNLEWCPIVRSQRYSDSKRGLRVETKNPPRTDCRVLTKAQWIEELREAKAGIRAGTC